MTTPLRVVPLAWDSERFGLRVGRVEGVPTGEAELTAALQDGMEAGLELIYWLAPDEALITPSLLEAFGGRLVVGHRLFDLELTPDAGQPDPAITSARDLEPTPALRDLARLAGHLSRFKRDDRLSPAIFDSLYDAWLEGSLSGRVADEVLVARSDSGDAIGLVTLSVREEIGRIGLIATAPAAQRQGLGGRLMQAAHAAMLARAARRAQVATQAENTGACRLYQSLGYATIERGHHVHFLPSRG